MSRPSKTVENVLSFDLEHWYTATLIRESVTNPIDRIESSVDRVLGLLNEHNVSATFFVVGEVAEEYPELVARVAEAGHELATHGHTHTPLFNLDKNSFAEEINMSVSAIREATGIEVDGFRAPNFSVTEDSKWAFDVLAEQGFSYDSSVFPVWTPMYGVRGAPNHPYCVDRQTPFTNSEETPSYVCSELLELPVAVHPRVKIPVAGGFYARLLPTRIIKAGIEALNARGWPAVLYFHPWEFNPGVKAETPPAYARFISYYGITRTADILETLLEEFTFGSISGAIDG